MAPISSVGSLHVLTFVAFVRGLLAKAFLMLNAATLLGWLGQRLFELSFSLLRFQTEIKTICKQYPSEPFKFLEPRYVKEDFHVFVIAVTDAPLATGLLIRESLQPATWVSRGRGHVKGSRSGDGRRRRSDNCERETAGKACESEGIVGHLPQILAPFLAVIEYEEHFLSQ